VFVEVKHASCFAMWCIELSVVYAIIILFIYMLFHDSHLSVCVPHGPHQNGGTYDQTF